MDVITINARDIGETYVLLGRLLQLLEDIAVSGEPISPHIDPLLDWLEARMKDKPPAAMVHPLDRAMLAALASEDGHA